MNNPSTRIVAAITLLLCGWILGFLRIPYVDITQSFFSGFIAGLFLLGLFLLTAYITKANWLFNGVSAKLYPQFLILVVLFGGLYMSLYLQGNHYNKLIEKKDERIKNLNKDLKAVSDRAEMLAINQLIDQFDQTWQVSDSQALKNWMEQVVGMTQLLTQSHNATSDTLKSDIAKGYLVEKLLELDLDSSTWVDVSSQCDLTYADLRGLNLEGVNFYDCDLSYCDLRGVNMRGVTMIDGSLYRTLLVGTDLHRSSFSNVNMSAANLSYADISMVQMIDSDLSWASLRGSDLSQSSAKNCNMKGAILLHALMDQFSFENVAIKGAYVDEDWFGKLKESDVRGWIELDSMYMLRVQDPRYGVDAPYSVIIK